MIRTSIAVLPRFSLFLLFRSRNRYHLVHDFHTIGGHFALHKSSFLFSSDTPADSQETLPIQMSYDTTIETLRALTSLFLSLTRSQSYDSLRRSDHFLT